MVHFRMSGTYLKADVRRLLIGETSYNYPMPISFRSTLNMGCSRQESSKRKQIIKILLFSCKQNLTIRKSGAISDQNWSYHKSGSQVDMATNKGKGHEIGSFPLRKGPNVKTVLQRKEGMLHVFKFQGAQQLVYAQLIRMRAGRGPSKNLTWIVTSWLLQKCRQ